MTRRERYDFFRANAGGWVGHNAETALTLARAEELLDEAEQVDAARFEWVDDPSEYDPGTETTGAEAARLFEAGTWTGPYGAVLAVGDDPATRPHGRPWSVTSLWGIVLGPDGTREPYARVVRAELAAELDIELDAAITRAQVRTLADELAERVGARRASDELRGVLDVIEQEAGR